MRLRFGSLGGRFHRIELFFRASDAGLRAGKLRLRGRNLARGVHRFDGHVEAGSPCSRFGIGKFRLSMIDSDLIVVWIDLDEHSPFIDKLVILNVDGGHVTANACADRIYVAIDLRIVGGFVGGEITPDKKASDEQNRGNAQQQEGQAPPRCW